MEVTVAELDLQLDAGEERRGRVEDEPVGAGLEVVGQAGAAVLVGARDSDHSRAAEELYCDVGGRLAGARVEDMGGQRRSIMARIFALAPDGGARSRRSSARTSAPPSTTRSPPT